ncbi:MAG: replication protein C [Acidobacteria bacterium]|nr:replication protein C [Acidobacteriota bacterium]
MNIDDSAHEAPQESFAQSQSRANGCRRVTLEMRAWYDRADSFKGLPAGTAKPLTFLYAFKEAEPYLHLPAHTYKLVDWLVRLTKPQDWEEGSRPIAWPEARRQAEFLGVSPRAVQMLNRALQEAGIFVMRDDPQGRRYGHRDPKTGRITKAFGFDLSLLMERHEEFKKIAAEAEIERNYMKKLRQRKTLARKAIDQAAEELAVQGYDSEALQCLLQEKAELVETGSQCDRSDQLTLVVKALERRRDEIQQMLRDLIKPMEISPMGEKNGAHNTSTTLNDNDNYHTVIAAKECSRVETQPAPNDPSPSKSKHLFPETLHITPATLVELAPRLAPYMPARTSDKDWPSVVDAALYLSGEMGINRTLWGRACDVMGREYAAVAMAIVSTKQQGNEPGQINSSPGGYFAGMLRKFEKNPQDLCLSRTLWKLKEEIWGTEGHKERRELEKARRHSFEPDLAMTSAGSFRPIGTVLQRQPTALLPPTRPALPAPSGNSVAGTGNSKAWGPSSALLDEARQVGLRIRQQQQHRDEGGKSPFAKPEDSKKT